MYHIHEHTHTRPCVQVTIRVAETLGRPLAHVETEAAELQALTDTQHYKGCVLPAGQQQEVDQVVGNEAEAQDHTAPLLEALACRKEVRGELAGQVVRAEDGGSKPGRAEPQRGSSTVFHESTVLTTG